MEKIVFISNQYPPQVVGGAELSVQTLVDALRQLGHETVVVSLSADGRRSCDTVHGTRVHRLPVRNLYHPSRSGQRRPHTKLLWHALDVFNPSMLRSLERVLAQERPSWVSTHNLSGFSVAAWSAAKRAGVPLTHVIHDYYLLCPRTTMFRKDAACASRCGDCRVLSLPKKALSGCVDVAIGVSRFVLERHLDQGYFPRARTAVVPNGRPLKAPDGNLQDPEPGRPLRIGYIGRVEASKGVETLLQAVAQLSEQACELRLAGRARCPEYLRYLQERYPLPNVSYLGFVDPDSFYPSVDVVVVPSLWDEPLGMVAVEPLGYGVPVIASRVGGLPEVLEGDAGAGWLFEPGDAQGLRRRLEALVARPPDRRARAAARSLRKRFTPERQAARYLAALAVAASRAPIAPVSEAGDADTG